MRLLLDESLPRALAAALAVALLLVPIAAVAADTEGSRHLIYLHGRIVQDQQSMRPLHPQFGYYELEKIQDAFRDRGFVVSAEIRPPSASVSDAANAVVEQVGRLIESGVPAERITVVGASMGAAIALLASARLQNPDLRFCVLGACLSESIRGLVVEEGQGPSGHVLSIREASDDTSEPCPPWTGDIEPRSPLEVREIVLHTGLSHGFLYRPLHEWLGPVAEWAGADRTAPADPRSRE